jgi:hypothetical protein
MHEIAMHVDHSEEEFKPPYAAKAISGATAEELLTAAHIDALSECMSASHGIFNIFLDLHVDVIRAIPVFSFVRIAYAMIVLIKLHFAAGCFNSELGKVISQEDMRVEWYLDRLLSRFRQAAESDKCRPAQKFLMVLVMLKSYFQKQKEGQLGKVENAKLGTYLGSNSTIGGWSAMLDVPKKADFADESSSSPKKTDGDSGDIATTTTTTTTTTNTAAAAARKQPLVSQQASPPIQNNNPDYPRPPSGASSSNPTSTPLHVLSEIAMSSSSGSSGNITALPIDPPTSTATPRPAYSPQQSWSAYSGQPSGYEVPPLAQSLDNVSSTEFNMGDGFEQMMGMTMGAENLADYFRDDVFFNDLLKGMGSDGIAWMPTTAERNQPWGGHPQVQGEHAGGGHGHGGEQGR